MQVVVKTNVTKHLYMKHDAYKCICEYSHEMIVPLQKSCMYHNTVHEFMCDVFMPVHCPT